MRYNYVPKFHYLWHLIDMLRVFNAFRLRAYANESMIGSFAGVCRQTMHGQWRGSGTQFLWAVCGRSSGAVGARGGGRHSDRVGRLLRRQAGGRPVARVGRMGRHARGSGNRRPPRSLQPAVLRKHLVGFAVMAGDIG